MLPGYKTSLPEETPAGNETAKMTQEVLRSSTGHFFTFVVTGKEAKQAKKMTCSASSTLSGHKTSSPKETSAGNETAKMT